MKPLFPFALLSFLAVLLLFSGCDKDPCQSAQCGYGECKTLDGEAVCQCSSGYERDASGSCTVGWYEKFTGEYTCTEIRVRDGLVNDPDTISYPVTVKLGSSNRKLTFSGLGGGNEFCTTGKLDVRVRLDSIYEFTIESAQTYCPGDPNVASSSIEGDGKLEDGEIVVAYRYAFDNASNAHSYVCKAILRK